MDKIYSDFHTDYRASIRSETQRYGRSANFRTLLPIFGNQTFFNQNIDNIRNRTTIQARKISNPGTRYRCMESKGIHYNRLIDLSHFFLIASEHEIGPSICLSIE